MAAKPDQRTTDTKEKVLAEAYRLYQAGGYAHMNLDHIAKTLHITRPALYHHFPDGKEQLMVEMIELYCRTKTAVVEEALERYPDARSRLRHFLLSLVDQPVLDQAKLTPAEREHVSAAAWSQIEASLWPLIDLTIQIFTDGAARGELRPVDRHLMNFSFGGLCRQVEQMLALRDSYGLHDAAHSAEHMVDQLLDLWLDGMAAPHV